MCSLTEGARKVLVSTAPELLKHGSRSQGFSLYPYLVLGRRLTRVSHPERLEVTLGAWCRLVVIDQSQGAFVQRYFWLSLLGKRGTMADGR